MSNVRCSSVTIVATPAFSLSALTDGSLEATQSESSPPSGPRRPLGSALPPTAHSWASYLMFSTDEGEPP